MKAFKQLLTRISPSLNTRYCYHHYFRRKYDQNNPITLDDKIQWLKENKYGKEPIYTRCADKVQVREYVKECGCEEILINLIGVYRCIEEINFESLPKMFVLKWNFGYGFNIVCPDKNKADLPKIKRRMRRWGCRKPHLTHAEMQYRDIPRRILCEHYLRPLDGLLPVDYKFFCFHGKAQYCMICRDRESGQPKFDYLDRDFRSIQIEYDQKGISTEQIPHDGIRRMFEYADRLCKGFDFVRVDLYLVDEQIYFGELTFSPAGGYDRMRTPEGDKLLGSLLHLP